MAPWHGKWQWQKQGKIVVITETVITVILGVFIGFQIIIDTTRAATTAVILNNAKNNHLDIDLNSDTNNAAFEDHHRSSPGVWKHRSGNNGDVHTDAAVSIGVLTIVLCVIKAVVFEIYVGLLYLLWSGIDKKQSLKCKVWYITEAVFCALGLLSASIDVFSPQPWYFYVAGVIYYVYRIWTIHVVKMFTDGLERSSRAHATDIDVEGVVHSKELA